jgi:hypothetical protein
MLIPIYGRRGCFTHVSPEDFDFLSAFRWSDNHGYLRNGKGGQYVWLHHEVLRLAGFTIPHGMETDHINGDPWDNRRENLRIVTRAANLQNKKPLFVRFYCGTALPESP